MNMEIPPQEKEPVSYEKALDAIKSLRLAGIKNPMDDEDPTVQEAFDIVNKWKSECGLLGHRNIDDVEKAKNIVKGAMFFIDAGYTNTEFIREAIDFLNGEYNYEIERRKKEGDEITTTLETAIKILESKLEQVNPKEKFLNLIEKDIEEAKIKAKSGERTQIIDAVRQLVSTTLTTKYKRYFVTAAGKKKLDYLNRLIDVAQNIKNGGDSNQIDSVVEE